jgi:CheY-like chemotaxis protein
MSDEVIAHLFEPFFTTKPQGKGTGLGLPAVYGAMKNHKGAITVTSEPGAGSTFALYLPLQHVGHEVTPKALSALSERTYSILFVDDEAGIRSLASDMLEVQGHTVTTCADGQEAIEVYRAQPHDFDLVILDLIMPKLSGHETFRALRVINPKVKVLLCSGYSLSEQAQEILQEGAAGFLQKPFLIDDLQQKIAEIL